VVVFCVWKEATVVVIHKEGGLFPYRQLYDLADGSVKLLFIIGLPTTQEELEDVMVETHRVLADPGEGYVARSLPDAFAALERLN
jgi:hypothetical protein